MDKNKLNDLAGRLQRGGRGAGVGAGFLAAAGSIAYGLYQSMYTVDGGHRAIIFSRIGGIQNDIYTEGLHFRIPWFQYPIIYDIRARPRKISSPTGSKDLQMVNISLRVLSRPDSLQLPAMYRQLGTDFDERVLPSICNEEFRFPKVHEGLLAFRIVIKYFCFMALYFESQTTATLPFPEAVLKGIVAKFNASQLITQRQQVSLLVRKELTDRARDFNIILDDVAITELAFGKEYTAAVESKQVAQQEAQRAQFVVEKAKQERLQKIVQAEGETAAARLIGEAVAVNPGYLKLRKIRASQAIARTIAASKNRVYLDAANLMLNVSDINFDDTVDNLAKGKKK